TVAIAYAGRSILFLHAMCPWCMFVWVAGLLQFMVAMATCGATDLRSPKPVLPLAVAAVMLTGTAWGLTTTEPRDRAVTIDGQILTTCPRAELLPPELPVYNGPPNSAGVLVAFLNFDCPACKQIFPE